MGLDLQGTSLLDVFTRSVILTWLVSHCMNPDILSCSWRVSTRDPNEMYKLSTKKAGRDGLAKAPTKFKCPMTGLTAVLPTKKSSSSPLSTDKHISFDNDFPVSMACPHMRQEAIRRNSNDTTSTHLTSSSSHTVSTVSCGRTKTSETGSLSATVTKKLFPYHALVNSDFIILQVGRDLPRVLHSTEHELVGRHLDEVFEITKPIDAEWSWDWLRKLEDQSFSVEPAQLSADCSELNFKTSVVLVNDDPAEAMLIMCPDANNLEDLRDMGLTLSDFPIHGSHREVVFLREHLSTQMNNALNMEKLQVKSLAKEKALLESLLPVHAAEGLRKGRTVEPILHNNVTMFFSDVVGFTNICDQLYPWEVISMLNRLYWVMDHLSLKFKLFKVETIGDAYVCCSGLPQADEQHAENVANFAIAVSHCCKQVLSPVDRRPIQLRIGIHTGPCASGVVGVTNPRYCVFGDTVNTTSRHESTGEPGKVHCSEETCKELKRTAPENFKLVERGLVEMKGKGQLRTFWLTAKAANKAVNRAALTRLNVEVKKLLQETSFESHVQSSDGSSGDPVQQLESHSCHSLRKTKVATAINDVGISIEKGKELPRAERLESSKCRKSGTVLSDHKKIRDRGESKQSMFFL